MAKTKKMDNRRSSRKSLQSNKTAETSRVIDTTILTLTHEERNDFLTPFVRPLVETKLRNGGKRLGKGEIENLVENIKKGGATWVNNDMIKQRVKRMYDNEKKRLRSL